MVARAQTVSVLTVLLENVSARGSEKALELAFASARVGKNVNVIGIKEGDVIYFDKNNTHQIEIKKEIYQVVNMAHVVVVL